jgi:hypothetical protein
MGRMRRWTGRNSATLPTFCVSFDCCLTVVELAYMRAQPGNPRCQIGGESPQARKDILGGLGQVAYNWLVGDMRARFAFEETLCD